MAFVICAKERILVVSCGKLFALNSELNIICTYSIPDVKDTLCACFSQDGNTVAIANENKSIHICKFDGHKFEPFKDISVKKAPTSMIFSKDMNLFLTDRAGYLSSHSINNQLKSEESIDDENPVSGRLILGHMSMLLNLALNCDENLIASGDRDEKIRISAHPNNYNIQAFCLGHTQYVRCVAFAKIAGNEVLISGSADGTLKLWNPMTGIELLNIDLNANSSEKCEIVVTYIITPIQNVLIVAFDRMENDQTLSGGVKILEFDNENMKLERNEEIAMKLDEKDVTVLSMCKYNNNTVFALVSTHSLSKGEEKVNVQQKFSMMQIQFGLNKEVIVKQNKLPEQVVEVLKNARNNLPLTIKNARAGNLDKYFSDKKERMAKKRKIIQ